MIVNQEEKFIFLDSYHYQNNQCVTQMKIKDKTKILYLGTLKIHKKKIILT